MDEFNYLEEPPPIYRPVSPADTQGNSRKLGGWAGRPAAPPPSGGRDFGALARTRSLKGYFLALAGLAVISAQAWFNYDLRRELGDVRTRLEESNRSLGLVWESTKRLDEDRMTRIGVLADSIRSLFDYAAGEVRLWGATYANFGHRVDQNDNAIRRITNALRTTNARLDVFARADRGQRARLDLLERQGSTNSKAVQALSQRATSQKISLLADELRRLRMRVDSMRPFGRVASSYSRWQEDGRRSNGQYRANDRR